jgi:carboxyl-terminal processing protease
VGIEVEGRDGQLTVLSPIEGSPAEKAGVRSGDHVIAVDGVDSSTEALDKIVRRMRGAPGTHVKLTLRRDGVEQPIQLDLVREEIHVPSVAARLLDGNIAYVRVKQFQDHTHDELLAAAGRLRGELKDADVAAVVLDLRANPGGLVDESAEVADEFLSSGTIYTTRHRGQVIDDVKAKGGGAFSDAPVVVLVNEYTASAAELVAGALQDQKRALVVGARTFGKGSVQSIISLPGGAGLKLTTARYYTPSGHSVQADGIHPDVSIESTRVLTPPGTIVRERDYPGHLPPEGPPGSDKGDDAGVFPAAQVGDGGAAPLPDTLRSDARNVPKDPTQGADFTLRVGYELVKTLVGRGPLVR